MPKDLRGFLNLLAESAPEEIVHVAKPISPRFEIMSVVQHLENRNSFPAILFQNVYSVKGELSPFKVAVNLHATRQKCALALDLPKSKWRADLSKRYTERQARHIKPAVVSRAEAPVKEVVVSGGKFDLRDLPILTHHELDGQPYLEQVIVAADPDNGIHNASHHRCLITGPRRTTVRMSPRHLWNYYTRAEERGQSLPIAFVAGHHPAFHLGSESHASITDDEYEIIGGCLDEPLRLVPSEIYGDRLLVPADAELVIEGEILPHERDAEAPFGEYLGYYAGQRWCPVAEWKGMTHRREAILMDAIVGHPNNRILGGVSREGWMLDIVKHAVPTAKEVHFPISGACRFACYISIKKRNEGEGFSAGMAALPFLDQVKLVIVVDDDIDVFNETEVLWAVATRMQADKDVVINPRMRGPQTDPSQTDSTAGAKMVIDATMPKDRAFEERAKVPADTMERIKLEDFLPREFLAKLG